MSPSKTSTVVAPDVSSPATRPYIEIGGLQPRVQREARVSNHLGLLPIRVGQEVVHVLLDTEVGAITKYASQK